MKTILPCTLCGLPVKTQADPAKDVFCCNGCKMVHAMLMESRQCKDATDFKDTALYKQCVAAGVIPDTTGQEWSPEAPAVAGKGEPDPATPFDSDTLLTFHFQVKNMWCPACAWVLENALTRSNGVTTASCNFSSDRGTVRYDPIRTSPDKIFTTIEKLGYKPAFLDQRSRTDTREFIRLFATLFLTMNVMMLSWAVYSGFFTDLSARSVQLLAWPAALMASVVVFWGGYPIHRRTLSGIRSGWTGMETLISTGSLSTYGYSLFQLSRGSLHLYFDASSMLILLILTGKMLEQNARNRISQGLGAFFSLVPQKVRICTDPFPNGRYVSIRQLSKGDLFMAEEGEILAADGVVTRGEALIDESSVTGEAKPLRAGLDHKVKSGTRVISGKIQVKAKEVGETSILGRMLKSWRPAFQAKPPGPDGLKPF
nr:cation-translocating P-type ATPase [Desulfobacula sp.]